MASISPPQPTVFAITLRGKWLFESWKKRNESTIKILDVKISGNKYTVRFTGSQHKVSKGEWALMILAVLAVFSLVHGMIFGFKDDSDHTRDVAIDGFKNYQIDERLETICTVLVENSWHADATGASHSGDYMSSQIEGLICKNHKICGDDAHRLAVDTATFFGGWEKVGKMCQEKASEAGLLPNVHD